LNVGRKKTSKITSMREMVSARFWAVRTKSDLGEKLHEAFSDFFFGHASHIDGGLIVTGWLWLGATHGSQCSHRQHRMVRQVKPFTLVGSTKDSVDYPVRSARCNFI